MTWNERLAEQEAAKAAHDAQQAAEEAATKQKEAAERRHEELERNRETGGPPTYLNVTPINVHGSSYRKPGHTTIYIGTNMWAKVSLTLRYPGHNWPPSHGHFLERLETEGEDSEEEWPSDEGNAWTIPWDCHFPGLVEEYEVRAQGENGGAVESGGLVVKGRFKNDVSRRWCKLAKHQEVVNNRRHARAEARRAREYEQRVIAEAREERERETAQRHHFEDNCRAIGGTPVGIQSVNGPETVCRAPSGGILTVPL